MEQSNLFLQTSWAEGFSNSTLEAQALGLPVVVTPVSGMNTIVDHRVTGYVTKDFTNTEVLNGLNWFTKLSKQELGKIAENASIKVQERFSGEDLKNNWLAFFN